MSMGIPRKRRTKVERRARRARRHAREDARRESAENQTVLFDITEGRPNVVNLSARRLNKDSAPHA